MDSCLSGMSVSFSKALEAPDSHDPSDAFRSCAVALEDALQYATRAVAKAHGNLVLSRRDANLSATSGTWPLRVRSSLRALPLSDGSLFGPHVQATFRDQTRTLQDLASPSAAPRPAPQRQAPPGLW